MSISPRFCSSASLPRGERGFTLIEVLVAVSLLAILLTAVYGIFGGVNSAKLRLDRDSADYHLARVIFDRFGRELHGAYFRSGDQTTMFRGGVNDQDEPFLELTTTAVTLLSETGSGISEVRYRLAPDQEADTGRQVLLRGERSRQSAAASADDRMMRLAPDVASLSLRFYTGGRWLEQWDARQSGLPQLVEVSLVVGQDEQQRIPFTTTFEIPDVSGQ
ncbi:MAG: type II secretion system protein GspJ [Desulfobulbia bacterium]